MWLFKHATGERGRNNILSISNEQPPICVFSGWHQSFSLFARRRRHLRRKRGVESLNLFLCRMRFNEGMVTWAHTTESSSRLLFIMH